MVARDLADSGLCSIYDRWHMSGRRRSVSGLRCTFCGRRADVVELLVPGPRDAAICNECVERAQRVIDEQRTGRDWAARVAAIDSTLGARTAVSVEDAALLLERANALMTMSRESEALKTFERVLDIPSATGPPELRIAAARALGLWLQLTEELGTPLDPIRELDRINDALDGMPGDDTPAAMQSTAELLVEKALLLERAGRDGEVADLLDAMVNRFAHLEDPHATRAAGWALRNRIASRLDSGRDEEALADTDRLRALWRRADITEHVAAVWKLLMLRGHDAAAMRLIGENFDRDLESAARELPIQQARTHLAMLVSACHLGETDEADEAALRFIEVLRSAPDSPDLAEMLDLLRSEYGPPQESHA